MANIEDTAIFISLALISIHAFTLTGSQQLLSETYSNVGFSFLPAGASTTDLNASSFELFNFQGLEDASINPFGAIVNAIQFILKLASIAFTIFLAILEFFVNIPIYTFVLLQTIGLPSYMIWPILVVIFAIEMWGLLNLFLRFISAVAGAK